GGVYVAGVANQIASVLLERTLESAAASGQADEVAKALERLSALVGDPELESSPAALIGKFRSALQTAAGAPHDSTALRAVLSSAEDLVTSLNSAAELSAAVRQDAQSSLGSAVEELQLLVENFANVNSEIVAG